MIIIILLLFSALLLISCKEKTVEIIQISSDTAVIETFKLPLKIPDKPIIVFCSDRTGDYELYYMNIDGSYIIQATSSQYADYHPRFSPDDSKLVFVSSRDGGKSEIYVMNTSGSDVKRLTENEISDDDPCFSPDGASIFYTAEETEQENQIGPPKSSIFMMNADGSGLLKIKDDPNGNYSDYDPAVSPDGKKLLFSSSRTYDDEIYIMDIEGSLPTNLTNEEGWDGRPCFSPDGTRIVFVSGRDGSGETADIYIMNSDGTGVKRLTKMNAWNTDPCFSPDGSRVVFSSQKYDTADIFIMDVNGRNITQLTKNAGNNYYPRFSSE